MRIGIDGRALSGHRTGIGRYVYELCQWLDQELPEAEFFIYCQAPLGIAAFSPRWTFRIDDFPLANWLKPVIWLKLRCGHLCDKDRLDVFWGAASFLPTLPDTVRTVVTVYDLNFLIVPETMSATHRWSFRLFFGKDVARADSVATISQGTSDRLRDRFGRSPDAIVYPAVSETFRRPTDKTIGEVLSKYSLEHPYLLAVATWEPRKNLETLIHTFNGMKAHGELSGIDLVLVGGKGWKCQGMNALATGSKSVTLTGYVPDDDLPALYAGAEAFVFPSIYEGFGLPVLEARACATKVIASDIPELREAGDEDTIYVEPVAATIRDGILTALSRPKPPDRTHDKDFPSWQSSARILASSITRLVRK